MADLIRSPLLVFAISLIAFLSSTAAGAAFFRNRENLDNKLSDGYNIILGATLTFLSLIVGFSFSMAVGRYDQRKLYEEAESNAIGTEYVRVDLLPAADSARIHTLLKAYIDQRVLFYVAKDENRIQSINARTGELQNDLWSAVKIPAAAQPTPIMALSVSGMNDVLNSQSYTQAAWWNRIPIAAWALMAAIGIVSNILVGYGTRQLKPRYMLPFVVPAIMSISFFLISDIDSPRGGIIHVVPQNLLSLAESLHVQPEVKENN